jgi:hypothetical protein
MSFTSGLSPVIFVMSLPGGGATTNSNRLHAHYDRPMGSCRLVSLDRYSEYMQRVGPSFSSSSKLWFEKGLTTGFAALALQAMLGQETQPDELIVVDGFFHSREFLNQILGRLPAQRYTFHGVMLHADLSTRKKRLERKGENPVTMCRRIEAADRFEQELYALLKANGVLVHHIRDTEGSDEAAVHKQVLASLEGVIGSRVAMPMLA